VPEIFYSVRLTVCNCISLIADVDRKTWEWTGYVPHCTASQRGRPQSASPLPHGVRLSPLGTADTVWPIVPARDNRSWWLWINWWNENWQGKPKYSEKTYPSTALFTTNRNWPDPGSNPDRRDCSTLGLSWLSSVIPGTWNYVTDTSCTFF
jgi:hypothetical protein